MSHLAGVRLQLRRKDCINSIALVDVFQTVWIAGWKQKEHPMLHNALHIGDQVLSIAGKPVTCSTDAHKYIREWPGLYVSNIFIYICISLLSLNIIMNNLEFYKIPRLN